MCLGLADSASHSVLHVEGADEDLCRLGTRERTTSHITFSEDYNQPCRKTEFAIMPEPQVHLDVGGDGVAVITLDYPPMNALHPKGLPCALPTFPDVALIDG